MLQLKKNKGAKIGVVAASLVAVGSLFGLVQRQPAQDSAVTTTSVLAAQPASTPIRTTSTSSTKAVAAATTTTKQTNTRTHVS